VNRASSPALDSRLGLDSWHSLDEYRVPTLAVPRAAWPTLVDTEDEELTRVTPDPGHDARDSLDAFLATVDELSEPVTVRSDTRRPAHSPHVTPDVTPDPDPSEETPILPAFYYRQSTAAVAATRSPAIPSPRPPLAPSANHAHHPKKTRIPAQAKTTAKPRTRGRTRMIVVAGVLAACAGALAAATFAPTGNDAWVHLHEWALTLF
jgi:hypothetical protein